MRLHLIRHAKTEQFSPTGKDFDRQLMARGRKQSQELQEFLEKSDISNSQVHCSSAVRTKETWGFLAPVFPPKSVFFQDEFYLCSHTDYLKWLWQQNHNQDILIIGHNFGISDLANYFLDTDFEMRTAAYLCIEFSCNSWMETSRATGLLVNQFRPSAG